MSLNIELNDQDSEALYRVLSDEYSQTLRALNAYEDGVRAPDVRVERALENELKVIERLLMELTTKAEQATGMNFDEWMEMVTTDPGINVLDNLEVEAAIIQNLGSNASLERMKWWWDQLTYHAKECLLMPAFRRCEYKEEYEEMMLNRRLEAEGEARAEAQSYADEFGYYD